MSIAGRLPVLGKYIKRKPSSARTYFGIDSKRRKAPLFFYPIRMLVRAIARTQHSEIQAIGLENIPPDGAVFLVGNHPNSFLDFFNLVTVVRHPVATAAKDTITRIPVLGHIVTEYAMIVPVSRAQDKAESKISEEERLKANKEMVARSVKNLINGRLFNIYAEGRSTDSRKLNKIKLGFMLLGIEAEKGFNFFLNLRIVPYGYFYDRINKFQSSVCIIFGKPFKINKLIKMPADFLLLSPREQRRLEKKIMLAGKERLKSDIENSIISIADQSLVALIDDISDIYLSTPGKYMGHYRNIREKYSLCKIISESIQTANNEENGRLMVRKLRQLILEYRKKLLVSRMSDTQIRREYSLPAVIFHLKSIAMGILFSPLIFYGYIANYVPRNIARFTRYWIIDVKKKAKVDGDERAIIAAVVSVVFIYPLFSILIYYSFLEYGFPIMIKFIQELGLVSLIPNTDSKSFSILITAFLVLLSIYLMGRLWRFSLFYGRRFSDAMLFIRNAIIEIFRKKHFRHLRHLRHKIIDTIDFIIGDYS